MRSRVLVAVPFWAYLLAFVLELVVITAILLAAAIAIGVVLVIFLVVVGVLAVRDPVSRAYHAAKRPTRDAANQLVPRLFAVAIVLAVASGLIQTALRHASVWVVAPIAAAAIVLVARRRGWIVRRIRVLWLGADAARDPERRPS